MLISSFPFASLACTGAGKSSIINALRLGRHRPDQEPLLDLPADFRLPPADVIMSQPSSADSDSEAADSEASSSRGAGAAAAGEASVSGVDFLAVGEMSRMGRGMHTTTSVTLIKLQGDGMLADTPGKGGCVAGSQQAAFWCRAPGIVPLW